MFRLFQMSDNYNQIPISVNTRHQSQLNNISNITNQHNADKSTILNPATNSNALNNATFNHTHNSNVNPKTILYNSNKFPLNNSTPLKSNSIAEATSKNPPITKIITRSNDLDFDYLDLNELNNAINNNENDNYDLNESNEDELDAPKTKRSVLMDTYAGQNKANHHHRYSRYESLLLRELSQLGIKREKLEKALASTGYQNSVDAINWLMKHSKDPLLTNDSITSSRDYMLVMCPIGRLASQISTFFQQTKLKCGPNEAHYHHILPYMKLSPFFKVIFYLEFRIKIIGMN